MPDFFQNMPGRGEGGVYANIWQDLDTTPAVWHITEVSLADLIYGVDAARVCALS